MSDPGEGLSKNPDIAGEITPLFSPYAQKLMEDGIDPDTAKIVGAVLDAHDAEVETFVEGLDQEASFRAFQARIRREHFERTGELVSFEEAMTEGRGNTGDTDG